MNIIARAAWYFAGHPDVNEFHITSDGMAFFTGPDAESHARTLTDRKVYPVKRYPNDEEAEQYKKLLGATNVSEIEEKIVEVLLNAHLKAGGYEPASPADFSGTHEGPLAGLTLAPATETTQEPEQTKEPEPVLPVPGGTSPENPAGDQEGDPAHDQGVVSEEDPATEKKKPGRKPAAK